ncbi:MAG: TonB-dependent receptor [Nostoc sp.]
MADQEDTAFSPRIGIVYQPIQPVSLYASYSRSFQSSGARGQSVFGLSVSAAYRRYRISNSLEDLNNLGRYNCEKFF